MTNNTPQAATCDVCGSTKNVDLCSSGLGPVSYSRCEECQSRGAEAIGVVCYWLFTYGGPSSAPDHFDLVVSHLDEAYVCRNAIVDFYPEFERVFLAEQDNEGRILEEDDGPPG